MNSPAAQVIKLLLRIQHPLLRRLHHPSQVARLEPLLERAAILPKECRQTSTPVGRRKVLTIHNERPDCQPERVLVYIHGGGYNTGNPKTHRAMAARLMQAGKFGQALIPAYRLAPVHPFPAGPDDILAFWQDLLTIHPAETLYLAGESAGAGLCLGLCQRLRSRALPVPVRVYLHSPWLDVSLSGNSYRDLSLFDGFTGRHPHRDRWIHRVFARHYAGSHSTMDPAVSPVFGDMRSLPPLYVHTGSQELFLDDSHTLVNRCRAAGTPCELEVWDGMWHGFAMFAPLVPEARQALSRAGYWLETGGFLR